MTNEKISQQLEDIVDELTSIKEKWDEFDFAIVVTWTEKGTMTMDGDCAITEMERIRFETIIENLIYTYNQQKKGVSYYGNSWSDSDNIIN